MVPKIIHYCWFGGKPKRELANKCISSWRRYCPGYEIIEWNESNFDVNFNKYVNEAFNSKKWAFVTDVVRLYVLVKYGGIYMDTDVEVLKPLDEFLDLQAFSGFESNDAIPTGIMGSEKGFPLFKSFLQDYSQRHFLRNDGSFDLSTNCTAITDACLKKGLLLNNQKQSIEGFTLFPSSYFCPKDSTTGKIHLTDNTYTIHHFSGSWKGPKQKFKAFIRKILGRRLSNWISKRFEKNKD